MYLPAHFAEADLATQHALLRAHPLATLVTHGPEGLDANHVPLQLDAAAGPQGTLRGHVARANPLAGQDGQPILAVFTGPAAYISPAHYATKAEHGKVVPTWNYTAVHAYGRLRTVDDPAWLLARLRELTAEHEAGRPQPWAVDDAPADYLEKMLRAVVGIEIVIERLIGKWKVSQNQPAANRDSLRAAFAGQAMGELIGWGTR